MSFSTGRPHQVESTKVTSSFAIEFWGRQNFTLGEDLLSKNQPLVHASSSKSNHLLGSFLLLSFACFYITNAKLIHFPFLLFHFPYIPFS